MKQKFLAISHKVTFCVHFRLQRKVKFPFKLKNTLKLEMRHETEVCGHYNPFVICHTDFEKGVCGSRNMIF